MLHPAFIHDNTHYFDMLGFAKHNVVTHAQFYNSDTCSILQPRLTCSNAFSRLSKVASLLLTPVE